MTLDKAGVRKQYWAFISYSSKDRRWGEWLHRRLENYPIPPEFRGLEVFDGAVLGKNLRPVFRDRDELAGSSDLGSAIHEALQASRFLVVLCSKRAAQSKWVNKEIEDFRTLGKGDRILALILDGEPNATAQGRPGEECFPAALRYPAEPIAGDLRKEGDGKARGFLKILAGIAQLDFDKLYSRHERAQAKKRLIMGVVALALIASFAGLSIFAWSQQQAAEMNEQRAVSEKERADKESEDKQKNLEAASNADLASALKAWQEDFDAQQKKERVVGFNGKSRWHEAVALFARSLDRNPNNERAAIWLYDTISHQGEVRQDCATAVLKHEEEIRSASFSPDGTRVVTASRDKTARVWDAATGKPIGEPLRHEVIVTSASFSPDGTRVVTASWDKTARVWDAATGKPIGEPLRHEGGVANASFSPDGTRVVTASWDKTARVWDAATGKPIGEPLRHEGEVNNASFSRDGTRVLTAIDDKTARVWDAATGKPIGEPLHHEGDIISASFSPDGTRVVTASRDKTAQVWDASSGKPIGVSLRHEHSVVSARFSPDGTRVVTASWDKTARVWNAAKGYPIGEPLRHEHSVESASFSPDGTQVVTVSDKTVQVWAVASGNPIGEPLHHERTVNSASFSPDGTRVVTASRDNTVRVWNVARGKPLGEPLRHAQWVRRASFSPDGSRVVTASDDETARVWDVASGKSVGEPLRHGDTVWSASFSPDGSRVVTASKDKTARVWDAASGKPVGEPLHHEDIVWSASFSPDGSRVVTASEDKTARVWDAASGKPTGEPLRHEKGVKSASFNSDGSRVVTTSGYDARLWDAATGKPVGESMRHEGYVNSACFSPHSTRVVTASHTTAQVWDAATGKPIGEPLRHEGGVESASFSPDGTRVVTACFDNTARLWDVVSKAPALTPAVLKWVTGLAGIRYRGDGELEEIPWSERMALIANTTQLPPGWRTLGASVIASRPDRPFSATSRFTVRQIAERERDTLMHGGIESALRYDTTVPLARLLFANILEKEDAEESGKARAAELRRFNLCRPPDATIPARAAFLRRYDLDRLPDDATLWTRATKALIEAPVGAMVGIGPKAATATAAALPTAEKAIALLKDDRACPARMNLAHAYLFNGEFDKAKAIYEKYLGSAFEDGRKWNDELRSDFKLLREAGRDHPDMKRIEALLEAGK